MRSKELSKIIYLIENYRRIQGWHITDSPIVLAKSICIEAAELLENFQISRIHSKENIGEELADILMYTLSLAKELGLDTELLLRRRLAHRNKNFDMEK